jgi:hypothetical protein
MRRRPRGKLIVGALSILSLACLALAGTVIPAATAHGLSSRQEFDNCPKKPTHHAARNPWSPAQQMLAPHRARVINLCRYASGRPGESSLKLAGNALVDRRRTIRQLIHKFDALKRYSGPPLHCPADRGDEVLAFLYYRFHKVTIVVGLTGCRNAGNGNLSRAAFNFDGKNPAGPRLIRQLKRLTRRVHFAV